MEQAALSHKSIDELLSDVLKVKADTSSSKDSSHILRCRRPTLNDLDSIHEFVMHEANEPDAEQKDCNSIGYLEVLRKVLDAKGEPIPICIILEEAKAPGSYELRGFALWTFGYSTWKGRVVNLDTFVTSGSGIKSCSGSQNENNRTLMMCLVRMARILDCSRIVYQVSVAFNKFDRLLKRKLCWREMLHFLEVVDLIMKFSKINKGKRKRGRGI